jgi:cell wall-associated NlpC family hydrolase
MTGAIVLVWLYSTLCSDCSFADSALVQRNQVVTRALSYVGVPYRWGGTTDAGFDCAGLVQRVYADLGLKLPRTSLEQYFEGEEVPFDQLQAGDLVFFKNTYRRGISHVGIYAGNGVFIHAATSRRRVVAEAIARDYYTQRFAGARRIVGRSDTGDEIPAPPQEPSSDILLVSLPATN